MPALQRYTQKVFGGSLTPVGNVAVYGSLAAGAPAYPSSTSDLATIQSLSAWTTGLNNALIGNRSPALEDLNGLFVVLSQQIAYLLQNGIAEWDSGTTYYLGQAVRVPGTALVCFSLVDNNLANNPATDSNNWCASGSSYPVVATTSGAQIVLVNTNGHTINFNSSEYDPQGRYNTSTYRYTVPVPGAYRISANLQVDNNTGQTSTMELSLRAIKNSSVVARAAGTSVANPPGSRWYPQLNTVVVLAAGDTVEIQLAANDTVNSGTVTVSNSDWSISKLP